VPDEELLEELRRVAEQIGKPTVTIDEFNSNGKFHSSTIARRFGTWMKGLDAAGLKATRNLNIPTEDLFENLVAVWLKLGRQPRYADVDGPLSAFSAGTYANRFGGWRAALEQFVDWANASDHEAPNTSVAETGKIKRTPRTINWRLRALVLIRDGARCQLCGASVQTGATLHVDHVVPWSKGGETELENLQILCEPCNIGKSDFEPSTG
jgi:hypothetical protein